jgi:hypothetical protein
METMSDRSIPEFAPFGYTLALRMAQLLKGGRACWYPALLGFLCRVAAAAPRLGQACWACPSLQARGCRSWAACHPWAAARPPLAPPHSTPLTACPCTTRRCPVCPALCTALYVHRTVHHALVPHRVPRTLYRRRCGTGARLAVGAGCGPGAGEAGGLGHPGPRGGAAPAAGGRPAPRRHGAQQLPNPHPGRLKVGRRLCPAPSLALSF